ncbi:unnamed protein product [Rotaria socialis]|uniref:Uncharacterized protein n=1 Tax=Rotaria socialis TaxID=392032 RepID=A0A820V7Z1_9BILA|nr:unnamed protein product [Rotaria socialis]CAF3218454.1 unnamed protein product [Rotaria socialis]CAF3404090.1 unnamed protein product [Rotaria socialis]CAF3595447.1 unnamed protein product [Rotaria socialis]CAF4338825.1 unnamed protein product [Rotaria socialis]
MIAIEERKNIVEQTEPTTTNNNTSLQKTLLLGFTPLVIAILLYISLSVCIQASRCYSNWQLKRQLEIVRCSEQCLVVSNPSIDDSDQQAFPQVV